MVIAATAASVQMMTLRAFILLQLSWDHSEKGTAALKTILQGFVQSGIPSRPGVARESAATRCVVGRQRSQKGGCSSPGTLPISSQHGSCLKKAWRSAK